MNVLFMVSWYYTKEDPLQGGIFHYEQAKALQEYCNVAVYYPYDRTLAEQFTMGEEFGLLTFRSKYKLEDKLKNRLYMYRCMKNIVKTFHPDLIHGNVATEAGRFAVALGQIFHIPVVISEHSSPDLSGVESFPHYYYAKYAYKGSSYNTCVSDDVRKKLKRLFPKYSFYTVYNGINLPKEISSDKIYRIENKINVVVVAGMYDKEIKGIPVLLKAVKKISERRKDFIVHFIGGGSCLTEFKNQAKQLQVERFTCFYGSCSHEKVWEIVSQMDFMVSASQVESFGCAIAEAQMLGLPVLTTDCGGPRSIVTEKSGMIIKNNNEDALIHGFMKMLNNYVDYSKNTISSHAIDKFAMDTITKQYYKIYCDVLHGRQ